MTVDFTKMTADFTEMTDNCIFMFLCLQNFSIWIQIWFSDAEIRFSEKEYINFK